MKIIKAGFSKTFPLNQYYEKVWVEAELNDGEDERQVLYDLKRKVETFFFESSAAAEKQKEKLPLESQESLPQLTSEQKIINQINEITDIKVLESFALIAKNNPQIKEAYDAKLQTFSPHSKKQTA